MNYGSGKNHFPLQDVLEYALEFAQSQSPPQAESAPPYSSSPVSAGSGQDVEMLSPRAEHRLVV